MARRRAAAPGVAALLALLTLAVVASACAPGVETPVVGSVRPAAIDVDTPTLRKAKAEAGIEPCRPGAGEAVADGLPALTLPCFGGGDDVDLATLRGPLVINVWSVNCGPCRTEMPILQRFYERYGDRVAVVGIDFQDVQTELAMKLAVRSRVTYPLLADTQGALATADPVRLRALPTTAMVDADGRVVHVQAVEYKSLDQLVEAVREHLGVDL